MFNPTTIKFFDSSISLVDNNGNRRDFLTLNQVVPVVSENKYLDVFVSDTWGAKVLFTNFINSTNAFPVSDVQGSQVLIFGGSGGFGVQSVSIESKPSVLQSRRSVSINLGPSQIFNSVDSAKSYLLSQKVEPLSSRYRNFLTSTFFRGTGSGQIKSLFKDYRTYGNQVLPKIDEFFKYIQEDLANPSKCAYVLLQYAHYVTLGLEVDEVPMLPSNTVDMDYFKFQYLHSISNVKLVKPQV